MSSMYGISDSKVMIVFFFIIFWSHTFFFSRQRGCHLYDTFGALTQDLLCVRQLCKQARLPPSVELHVYVFLNKEILLKKKKTGVKQCLGFHHCSPDITVFWCDFGASKVHYCHLSGWSVRNREVWLKALCILKHVFLYF